MNRATTIASNRRVRGLLLESCARWVSFSLLVFEILACGNLSAAQAWDIVNFKLDLPPGLESAEASNYLRQAATTLDQSAPDIIVVREVPDWATGARLAQGLTSGTFRVVVCSSFRAGAAGRGETRQIAILSRQPAYLAWAEGWNQNPGGYAFAAFRSPLGKLGLFALTIDSQSNPLLFESEWEDAVAGFRTWQTNRLDAAVVLAPNPSEGMRRSFPGFETALTAPFPLPFLTNFPASSTLAVELPNVPERLPAFITTACPSIFTVTLGSPNFAARIPQPPQHVESTPDWQVSRRKAVDPASEHRLKGRPQTWLGLGAGAAFLICVILSRRLRQLAWKVRRDRPALAAETQHVDNGRSCPPASSPSAGEAVLGKLVADRTILLENQQLSAEAVNAAEELVAKVEQQLRQQTLAYNDRVEELTRELAAADEEGRLLIKTRIKQIKSQIIEKGPVRPE